MCTLDEILLTLQDMRDENNHQVSKEHGECLLA